MAKPDMQIMHPPRVVCPKISLHSFVCLKSIYFVAMMYGLLLSLKNEIVKIAPRGRVNCVAPGWVRTPMAENALKNPDTVYRALATCVIFSSLPILSAKHYFWTQNAVEKSGHARRYRKSDCDTGVLDRIRTCNWTSCNGRRRNGRQALEQTWRHSKLRHFKSDEMTSIVYHREL